MIKLYKVSYSCFCFHVTMKWLHRSDKQDLEDLDLLYADCQREINANTPEGWDAKVVNTERIKPYCFATFSLEGVLATIPVMTSSWSHASLINGFFGYQMIGGHPWLEARVRKSGAQIAMRRSDGRTSISVYSHFTHYKEAIDLAQSIVGQARSGYLKLNDASAAQL